MALSQNALQKKRMKKYTKRNDKRTPGGRLKALLGFSRDWAAASRAPVVDVLAPCNLFELGMDMCGSAAACRMGATQWLVSWSIHSAWV